MAHNAMYARSPDMATFNEASPELLDHKIARITHPESLRNFVILSSRNLFRPRGETNAALPQSSTSHTRLSGQKTGTTSDSDICLLLSFPQKSVQFKSSSGLAERHENYTRCLDESSLSSGSGIELEDHVDTNYMTQDTGWAQRAHIHTFHGLCVTGASENDANVALGEKLLPEMLAAPYGSYRPLDEEALNKKQELARSQAGLDRIKLQRMEKQNIASKSAGLFCAGHRSARGSQGQFPAPSLRNDEPHPAFEDCPRRSSDPDVHLSSSESSELVSDTPRSLVSNLMNLRSSEEFKTPSIMSSNFAGLPRSPAMYNLSQALASSEVFGQAQSIRMKKSDESTSVSEEDRIRQDQQAQDNGRYGSLVELSKSFACSLISS